MPTTKSSPNINADAPAVFVDFTEGAAVKPYTCAVSLHAHTNRSREGVTVIPPYLDRIPVVGPLARRELRAYERRNHEPVDLSKGWWRPPVAPEDVLMSEASQIAGRLGLHPIVSITDHDSIEAPQALRAAAAVPDDVPLSVEWTVPFERGFLHLGVHNLPCAHGEEIFGRLSAFTRQRDFSGLTDLLNLLSRDPETLVVLNHPLWDLAGIGSADHAVLVRRFLDEHRDRIHALEVNGYRTWTENLGAIALARTVSLPIVSGGDRHGCAANALLNLTSAATFGGFAREIREQRKSVVLIMPEYREELVIRKLTVATDALRHYPSYPAGHRHWTDRVGYERGGQARTLADTWPDGGPLWVRCATRTFSAATAPPLMPVLLFAIRLTGASSSQREEVPPGTNGPAVLPSRDVPHPRTTG